MSCFHFLLDSPLGYSIQIIFWFNFCPIHFMLYFDIYIMGKFSKKIKNIFLIPKNAFLSFQFCYIGSKNKSAQKIWKKSLKSRKISQEQWWRNYITILNGYGVMALRTWKVCYICKITFILCSKCHNSVTFQKCCLIPSPLFLEYFSWFLRVFSDFLGT